MHTPNDRSKCVCVLYLPQSLPLCQLPRSPLYEIILMVLPSPWGPHPPIFLLCSSTLSHCDRLVSPQQTEMALRTAFEKHVWSYEVPIGGFPTHLNHVHGYLQCQVLLYAWKNCESADQGWAGINIYKTYDFCFEVTESSIYENVFFTEERQKQQEILTQKDFGPFLKVMKYTCNVKRGWHLQML